MNTNSNSERSAGAERCCGTRRRAFKRLLIAVDTSEEARLAAAMGGRLATQLDADVVLMSVFSATCASTPEIGFIEPDIRAGCVAAGSRFLDELRAKMPDPERVETLLREGDPATEIVRAATIYDVDMIIMGTHARGRLARAVLGSTVHAVTQKATVPVMTVAHPPEERGYADTTLDRVGFTALQI